MADDLARLATHSARPRLAYLLLEFVPEATPTSTGELRLPLPFKHTTMASWLAIRPEHLSRSLKALEQDGVIRRGKSEVGRQRVFRPFPGPSPPAPSSASFFSFFNNTIETA
ncbi:MAG: Crp/Fnr family transcriptional regulator [Acidobacteria bacterium]|nr:Crp/Fnr family transcriptional regulator [Acidobacteriota bacterium]